MSSQAVGKQMHSQLKNAIERPPAGERSRPSDAAADHVTAAQRPLPGFPISQPAAVSAAFSSTHRVVEDPNHKG